MNNYRGSIKKVGLLTTLTFVFLSSFNCSIFESDDLKFGGETSTLLLNIINNGDLESTAASNYDPRIDILGIIDILCNNTKEGEKTFQGFGIGVEPPPGAYNGIIRSIKLNYANIDAYNSFLVPDLSEVLPRVFVSHERVYYTSPNLQETTTHTNFVANIHPSMETTEAEVCEDDLFMLSGGVLENQFHLHQFFYFNVYNILKTDIAEEQRGFLNQDFYSIEVAVARDHFPDTAWDGSVFLKNQYSLTMFIGLKDYNGNYIKFQTENVKEVYTIVTRALWVNGGMDFGTSIVYGSESMIGEGVTNLLEDFGNYMQTSFEPLP
jgi:hypothetical protein